MTYTRPCACRGHQVDPGEEPRSYAIESVEDFQKIQRGFSTQEPQLEVKIWLLCRCPSQCRQKLRLVEAVGRYQHKSMSHAASRH